MLGALCFVLSSCDEPAAPAPTPSQDPVRAKPVDVLLFPESLRAGDPAVNDFVEKAMKTSVGGDYDAFRLLWSETREPLSRSEFEKGWEAVREIEVLALERVRVERSKPTGAARDAAITTDDASRPGTGATDSGSAAGGGELIDAYALLAEVRFDPKRAAGRKEPARDVVLLLVQEKGAWKLSPAPKPVREWIREKAGKTGVERERRKALDVTQPQSNGATDAETKTDKPNDSGS